MGIKDLHKSLSRYGEEACTPIKFEDLSHMTIAIDASSFVYRYVTAAQDRYLTCIQAFIGRAKAIEMRPIFVFDGKPPEAKNATLEKRAQSRASSGCPVTSEHFKQVANLLASSDVDMIHAPCEAEAQCARMNRTGLVDAVASEDMDTLCFGAKVLLRNLNVSGKDIMRYDLDRLLHIIGLNMDQFVDFCILSGCDYISTIPQIGPVRAFKLIRDQKKTLQQVVSEARTRYPHLPSDREYEETRRLFLAPDVLEQAMTRLSVSS